MFFDSHLELLQAAAEANRTRTAWTGYAPIAPPDAARADALLGTYDGATLSLSSPTRSVITADEVSPYTGKSLNVSYSAPSVDEALVGAAAAATAPIRDHA